MSVFRDSFNVDPEQTQYAVLMPWSGSSSWCEQDANEVGSGELELEYVPTVAVVVSGFFDVPEVV